MEIHNKTPEILSWKCGFREVRRIQSKIQGCDLHSKKYHRLLLPLGRFHYNLGTIIRLIN